MKYLGVAISDNHLNSDIIAPNLAKMNNRLNPWKGKYLSLGGRLILTNSSLSSLPMYTYQKKHTRKSTLSGLAFSGKELKRKIVIIWRNGT
jgi:hypothetical protein